MTNSGKNMEKKNQSSLLEITFDQSIRCSMVIEFMQLACHLQALLHSFQARRIPDLSIYGILEGYFKDSPEFRSSILCGVIKIS